MSEAQEQTQFYTYRLFLMNGHVVDIKTPLMLVPFWHLARSVGYVQAERCIVRLEAIAEVWDNSDGKLTLAMNTAMGPMQ